MTSVVVEWQLYRKLDVHSKYEPLELMHQAGR